MAYGVRTYASDGVTVVFDSTTAVGGVVGDYRHYASGASGETVSYPQFAGLTPIYIDAGGSSGHVSVSTSAGYPVITVTGPTPEMAFAMLVY